MKKINIVDVCVILVIILLVIGAVLKFGKYNSKSDDTVYTTIEYQINIENIRNYTADAFQIGDNVYDSLSGVMIGKITNIERKGAENNGSLVSGEIVKVKDPNRMNVILTIETPGTVETDAYYANKSIELKINSSKVIETRYVKTTGVISSLMVK